MESYLTWIKKNSEPPATEADRAARRNRLRISLVVALTGGPGHAYDNDITQEENFANFAEDICLLADILATTIEKRGWTDTPGEGG